MSYKSELEMSNSILEIQIAYDKECERCLDEVKKRFPDNYLLKFFHAQLSIWLIAEKTAISKFGLNSKYWVHQKI